MKSKICLSIGNLSYKEVLGHLKKVELAEIRMDLLNFTHEQFRQIFQNHNNLIATFRSPGGDYQSAATMLSLAIDSGSAFIDVDVETPDALKSQLVRKAQEKDCYVIFSYHNFTETPCVRALNEILDKLFASGADIAKVACLANSANDCSRVLGLYENRTNLIALCMGNMGQITRMAAPFLGAPFTYASIKGSETASGQLEYGEVENFLIKHNAW